MLTLEEEAKALAEYRLANYKGANDTHYMRDSFEVQYMGFLGEVATARCFAFPREHLWNIGSDGGSDFDFRVNGAPVTLDVKTAGAPYGLMVSPRRQPADIYLLLNYIDGKLTFVGWASGPEVMAAPMRDYGYGAAHRIPIHRLHPIRTLCDLIARKDA